MTRKVLLLTTVGVALLALLGSGIFFISSNSGAVADTGTGVAQGTETQAPTTTSAGPSYDINIPWPSGWISQVGIDADVTEEYGTLQLGTEAMTNAQYFTVSTTHLYQLHPVSQVMNGWEATSWDFTDTPLSDNAAGMTEYAKKNQMGLFAWAEGMAAATPRTYAPVAKYARVIPLNSGDSAYAIQVSCHLDKELATYEFVVIPKAKNQFFIIQLISYGMCEDELWHLMTYTTFTQAK